MIIARAMIVPRLVFVHYRLLRLGGCPRRQALAAALRWARLLAA